MADPPPGRVAAVGGAVALGVAVLLLLAGGNGLDGFIRASPEFADPAEAPIDVVPAGEGFDGQFYFRLAAEPLSRDAQVEGISFDLPALRAARVGYPALAGGLALGQVGALPATLVLVNVLAAAAVAAAGAALARAGGRSPWWGLVVLAFPGFVYTIGLDLAELVEAAAVLGALVAIRAGRAVPAAAAMVVAVLTKETALALPLAVLTLAALSLVPVAGGRLASLRPPRPAWVAAAVAVAVAGAWQALLWSWWDEVPLLGSADKNIRVPFAGLVAARDALAPTSGEGLFRILSLAAVVVVVMAAVRAASSRAAGPDPAIHELAALLVALLVATLMSEFVWAGATSFMRGLTEVWVLSLAVVLTRPSPPPRLPPLVVVAALGATGATVVAEVAKRA